MDWSLSLERSSCCGVAPAQCEYHMSTMQQFRNWPATFPRSYEFLDTIITYTRY